MSPSVSHIAEDLFRREGSRLVAALAARLGTHQLQLAEDVVQEAMMRALQTWPYRGVPDNPAAWLTQTARNLALDHLRRQRRWRQKEQGIAAEFEGSMESPSDQDQAAFSDDTLRMMFVCFHPQLSIDAQTVLALRTLCGLSAAEIAAAYLTSEAAISKRLVRARQRIRELDLPFHVPETHELPLRLNGVHGALYLLFNEGYKASSGDRLVRRELCGEAIRLGRLLTSHPATSTPQSHALLSLMLFNGARLNARTDGSGNLLRLHEQDRSAWDRAMISEAAKHLAFSATGNALSAYHLEAAIAANHCMAVSEAATDWPRILTLYDQLTLVAPTPVTAMNRAVALSRVEGTRAGLDALDAISPRDALEKQHLYHAIRGSFAIELGMRDLALRHFRTARSLTTIPAECEFITWRIKECCKPGESA